MCTSYIQHSHKRLFMRLLNQKPNPVINTNIASLAATEIRTHNKSWHELAHCIGIQWPITPTSGQTIGRVSGSSPLSTATKPNRVGGIGLEDNEWCGGRRRLVMMSSPEPPTNVSGVRSARSENYGQRDEFIWTNASRPVYNETGPNGNNRSFSWDVGIDFAPFCLAFSCELELESEF